MRGVNTTMGKHDDDCRCDDHHHDGHGACRVENVRVFGMSAGKTLFPKTIKVPVALAETTVDVCVEANVKLEKPALEIIRVWKTAVLEQCELIPTFSPLTAKLFVKGFIRKNIEYTTADHHTRNSVCGDVRHTTALVPFDFCTEITFPAGGPTLQLAPDSSSTAEYLNKTGHAASLRTGLFSNRQVYNERPFCELLFSEFTELDMGIDHNKCKDSKKTFSTVREKIVLRLGLKILQEQQVPIPTTPPPHPTFPPCKKKW